MDTSILYQRPLEGMKPEEMTKLLYSAFIAYAITRDPWHANESLRITEAIEAQRTSPLWLGPPPTNKLSQETYHQYIITSIEGNVPDIWFILLRILYDKGVAYLYFTMMPEFDIEDDPIGIQFLTRLLNASPFPNGRWFQVEREGDKLCVTELSALPAKKPTPADYPAFRNIPLGITYIVVTPDGITQYKKTPP